MSLESAHPLNVMVAPENNLLIIDDDETIRRIMRRGLAPHFRAVCDAADQLAALQAIDGLGKGDFILSDLHLNKKRLGEGLDIAEITAQMRKEANIALILSSGAPSEDNVRRIQEYLQNGIIDAFVHKPYVPKIILGNMREILRARSATVKSANY